MELFSWFKKNNVMNKQKKLLLTKKHSTVAHNAMWPRAEVTQKVLQQPLITSNIQPTLSLQQNES